MADGRGNIPMNTGQPLDDGQEEIFVREEFETGRLEHHRGEETAALASGRAASVIGSRDASPSPGAGDSPEQRPPHLGHNGPPEDQG